MKTVIHSAVLRLTMFYIAALLVLSIGFSVFVYELSSNELERSAQRPGVTFYSTPDKLSDDLDVFLHDRASTGLANLRRNLIMFNIGIIAVGAAASYWFARRTMKPIHDAMEQQGRFTADASHELRTPLTVMKSEIEVNLRNSKLTLKEAKELLESNLEEVERLSSLANGLLKLTTGLAQDMPKETVALRKVSDAALAQLQTVADKKHTTIQNNIGPAAKVLGDQHSLQELITILVENAIKYSPEKATVALDALSSGKHLLIVVRDNGPGIKATDLGHIFDRFYRADTSRAKQNAEGYGLGLSIAKQIVAAHGGTIEATSELGKGTKFTVRLLAA